MSEQNCAACGSPIVQGIGRTKEFCSPECFRIGRAFCKTCGDPLQAMQGSKREFCSDLCQRKHSMRGGPLDTSYLDEQKRSTCKACGKSIIRSRFGPARQFCDEICQREYHKAMSADLDLTQKWGTYAPETRKILLELEHLNLVATAKRLAIAIDREYMLRHQVSKKPLRSQWETYQCKTCGRQFRRAPYGQQSRDYCSKYCKPKKLRVGEETSSVKLTWAQVNEIRDAYENHLLNQSQLARKYEVTQGTIHEIVHYKTWKLESGSHLSGQKRLQAGKRGENNSAARFTWEQIDEIRNLYATERLPFSTIAAKYGAHAGTIARIVRYQIWKPEYDPRVKQEVNE